MGALKHSKLPVMEYPAPLREGTLMKLLLGSFANAVGKLDSFSCRRTTTSQLPEFVHATPEHPNQVSESCCGNHGPGPVLYVWICEHTILHLSLGGKRKSGSAQITSIPDATGHCRMSRQTPYLRGWEILQQACRHIDRGDSYRGQGLPIRPC